MTEHRRLRVAVIFGGQSEEHDVSLRSAQTVIAALDEHRFEVVPVGIGRDGSWLTAGDPMAALTAFSPLFALNPADAVASDATVSRELAPLNSARFPNGLGSDIDVVFPVLHGPMGEDGTLQGLLELSGLPYVGSGVLGSSVAMDKAMTKIILDQAGVPQVPWMLVHRHDWQDDPSVIEEEIGRRLGFPCFTKPANMGSSVGIRKIHGPEELRAGLNDAAKLDRRLVVEQGVDAREFEVSVLGNERPAASVAGEVVPCNEFYDYAAKYIDEDSALIIPADVPAETHDEMRRLAIRAFEALDLAGLARVDFFQDRHTGALYLNEVNTLPGFTSISMFPRLWEASGVPISELVERLIELALARRSHTAAVGRHTETGMEA